MNAEGQKQTGSRLAGKSAIVTGSATGIGKATATLFAKEGARVVVSDIDETGGRAVVEAIQRAGGEAVFVKADVSRAEDAEQMVGAAVQNFGRLDVLVNNAAAYLGDGNLLTVADEVWEKILAVNLKGTFLCSKFAIARMIETGGGSIVNLASVNALMGLSLTAYTASKGGVQALTRLLAVDFAPKGIRVNSICPGTIMTENSVAIYRERPGLEEQVTKMYPMGKLGKPRDIAECALFLASDAASFVTGATFVVDGGLMAGRKFDLDYT
ncbi:MAG TPA: glucose 1-dehydrogenase [Bryobacteraceae bacterium]|nr:glucose 1-dehydrogenase [Bryobacteraceae bacterium]